MFTCQNSACKRIFTTPLKSLNLQENPTKSFLACPYCLTQVEEAETAKDSTPVHELNREEIKPKTKSKSENKEGFLNKDDKPLACRHHPGYLSEKASKEPIPDECLVCKNIVDCMLKRMKN